MQAKEAPVELETTPFASLKPKNQKDETQAIRQQQKQVMKENS